MKDDNPGLVAFAIKAVVQRIATSYKGLCSEEDVGRLFCQLRKAAGAEFLPIPDSFRLLFHHTKFLLHALTPVRFGLVAGNHRVATATLLLRGTSELGRRRMNLDMFGPEVTVPPFFDIGLLASKVPTSFVRASEESTAKESLEALTKYSNQLQINTESTNERDWADGLINVCHSILDRFSKDFRLDWKKFSEPYNNKETKESGDILEYRKIRRSVLQLIFQTEPFVKFGNKPMTDEEQEQKKKEILAKTVQPPFGSNSEFVTTFDINTGKPSYYRFKAYQHIAAFFMRSIGDRFGVHNVLKLVTLSNEEARRLPDTVTEHSAPGYRDLYQDTSQMDMYQESLDRVSCTFPDPLEPACENPSVPDGFFQKGTHLMFSNTHFPVTCFIYRPFGQRASSNPSTQATPQGSCLISF